MTQKDGSPEASEGPYWSEELLAVLVVGLGDETQARETLRGIIRQALSGRALQGISEEALASYLSKLYERIGVRFCWGVAGQSPQTGIVAPPPYRDPSPARQSGGRPAASFGGEPVCPFFGQNRLTIVISMNLVTPAVPCLRQVVHALADPASRDRP